MCQECGLPSHRRVHHGLIPPNSSTCILHIRTVRIIVISSHYWKHRHPPLLIYLPGEDVRMLARVERQAGKNSHRPIYACRQSPYSQSDVINISTLFPLPGHTTDRPPPTRQYSTHSTRQTATCVQLHSSTQQASVRLPVDPWSASVCVALMHSRGGSRACL